ncbi:MAG: two pore domain potassium channel family protein, partial [Oscillospiraceae bacterium]|nr:two pore domain potassium channel family protein [Oscillospiraceae bacterium]
MKRHIKAILGALALWLALLLLLLAAEGRSPAASIRSFGDALWFSLITMTTVGYGDLTPVTPLGRALGAVFALCSVGVLAALISLGLRLVGGE